MTIYDIVVKDKNNNEVSMDKYKGKTLLVVNTASKCGFTDQFGGLEELYREYKDQNFEIIGFPCDQFKKQEFGDINETVEFCQMNYGVTFEIMAKVDVNGENQDSLFKYLKSEKTGLITEDIKWNFTKFLIDKEGNVVKRYAPKTKPKSFAKDIAEIL